MSNDKSDKAIFERMLAKHRNQADETLARAKREATKRGKQRFNLDELERLYDTHTDTGFLPPRPEREREFEYRYYAVFPECMSLAEFATKQRAMDVGSSVRRLSSPAPLPPPVRVAGVLISDSGAVSGMITTQLQGLGPWSTRDDYTPVDGLQRAARDAGTLTPAFADAMVELLNHDDVAVRAGVIASLWTVAEHVDPERLMDCLEFRRGVITADHDAADAIDLQDRLVEAIATCARTDSIRSNTFLMKQLQQTGSRHALLALARTMPEWLAANAARYVPRKAILGVLRSLPTQEWREQMVRALSPWPPDEAKTLLSKSAWTSLSLSEGEKARLEALLLGRGS